MRSPLTKSALCLLGALLGSTAASAQDIDQRPGVWAGFAFSSTVNADDERKTGPHLWFDLHLRQRPPTSDDGAGSFLAIIRPGVGYTFKPWFTVDVGYAMLPVVSARGPYQGSEHRIWSHALFGSKVGRVALGFRPRVEARFRDQTPGPGLRVRTFGRAAIDLIEPIDLVLWDEGFWQLTQWGSLPPGLEENRLFTGIGWKTDGPVRPELGYMNRWIPASTTGGRGQMQHTALAFISYKPKIRTGKNP